MNTNTFSYVVCAIALGACTSSGAMSGSSATGRDGGTAVTPNLTAGATSSTNPQRSSGCGQSTARSGTLMVTSGTRTALVAMPSGYDASRAHPQVIAFHGGGGDGAGFKGYAGVEEAAGGNAIFLYPNGVGGVWESEVSNGDFDYLHDMVGSVSGELCVDSSRVYAFGFSWGGWAAMAIGCSASSWVHGIASVAGGGPMGSCGSAVPTMLIHGRTNDAEGFSSSESSLLYASRKSGCGTTTSAFAPKPCTGTKVVPKKSSFAAAFRASEPRRCGTPSPLCPELAYIESQVRPRSSSTSRV
jgi:polyhydroxybutyrate depolymerase